MTQRLKLGVDRRKMIDDTQGEIYCFAIETILSLYENDRGRKSNTSNYDMTLSSSVYP